MKDIIKSFVAFLAAIIGFFGGLIWLFFYNGEAEAFILASISFVEIIAYVFLKLNQNSISSTDKILNLSIETTPNENKNRIPQTHLLDRNAIIDSMKSSVKILFIDDDKNFNVVKILKNTGWKHTKTVTDVKTLEVPYIKESEIIFVDINGVGLSLNLEHEGLDLALMLKQKFPQKKIIIYSANKNSYSFHDAWDICDYKLEKNALPYQFQNLVEEYSIELYKAK